MSSMLSISCTLLEREQAKMAHSIGLLAHACLTGDQKAQGEHIGDMLRAQAMQAEYLKRIAEAVTRIDALADRQTALQQITHNTGEGETT